MDFVIDRTNEDVMYAQSFVGAVWSKMTNAQKEEWLRGLDVSYNNLKGFFNWNDMRRIRNNYNSLRITYSYSGDMISTIYDMNTIPNRTTMSADFGKIRAIGRAYLPYFADASYVDYRTLYDLPNDVNRMDYNFLNNYEHILKNLYDYDNDGELVIKSEYELLTNDRYALDGYYVSSPSHSVSLTVPIGFMVYFQEGSIVDDEFVFHSSDLFNSTGEPYVSEIVAPYVARRWFIFEGATTSTLVGSFGTGGNTVDVTHYDKVKIDSDLLSYSTPTTYTATEIQSSLIDVTSKVEIYCYDISVYGENTIVTLYDENEDAFDEIALRENTKIDLTNASYITFDTDVGTRIKYITSDGSTFSTLMVTVGGTTYNYPAEKSEFDVSGLNSITIMFPSPTSNTFICEVEKSIENGKDISQLNLDEIELKYI